MNYDMVLYYKERAKEYEKIYSKPERQQDLIKATEILQEIFLEKRVLEIACGTGYWTERIAAVAKEILATDINDRVIEVARSKQYKSSIVSFQTADIFELKNTVEYESLFAGFIWSHIKLQQLHQFIHVVNALVKNNGTIVFMDNNYIERSSTAIAETDEFGNTYQNRKLEDGTMHKVVKNFPDEAFIKTILKDKATAIEFINLKYYWILKYRTI